MVYIEQINLSGQSKAAHTAYIQKQNHGILLLQLIHMIHEHIDAWIDVLLHISLS